MTKAAKLGICAVSFCGWVIILASACYNQNKVGRKAMNFPLDWYGSVTGSGPSSLMATAGSSWGEAGAPAFAPGGKAISYLWWITSFQFFGILLAVGATSKPQLRTGAASIFAVLTASTFLYTYDVFSSPLGLYALTHDENLDIKVPTASNMNWRLYAYYKGIAALLTGLIICDICNFLSCIVLPIGDESLEAAPKYSKDAPAAAAAAEGEVKGEQV